MRKGFLVGSTSANTILAYHEINWLVILHDIESHFIIVFNSIV